MSHDRLAPSKSSRVLLCAASPNRESQFPDDEAGPAANEGSNVHWLGEHGLRDQQWPPKIMALGLPMVQASAPYPEVDISQENIDNAQKYYEYVVRRVEELKPATLYSEEKVNPQLYTGRDDSKGSCDTGIASANFLEVVDYKNGGIQVEADCSQLKLYALGMLAKHADPLSGLAPFDTVRLTVFQPKRPGVDTVERSEDFTQADLIDWAVEVWKPAADASDNPNARAVVTEEGCHYCKAQKHSACPEYIAASQRAAAQLFSPVAGQAVEIVDPLHTTFNVNEMSIEDISAFLTVWPLMKARGKDIEEHATDLLKKRIAIVDWKLVHGRGSRAWALEDEEEQAKKFKNIKLRLNQVFEQKLRSPAKMLALTDLTTKQKESIKKHVVNKTGALTLAPTSDQRVDAMPAVEFKPVEPQAEATQTAIPDFLSL